MQGYLQIWKGLIPHWNRYYFRIHQQLLLFGPTKEQIQGKIHLKIAQIISKLDDPISLMIHTGTEIIDLRAYSIDQKVKWFKKLKEVQKQAIDLAHNRQLFKMKVELSKVNRFKILDDLNTQLWKSHAQLEQRLEEVLQKVKNTQILKSIDRLRIISDEFKYKTSQILQYIDQQIRDLKFKDGDKSKNSKSSSKRKNSNAQNELFFNEDLNNVYQDTQYYSFCENQFPNKKKNQQYLRPPDKMDPINQENSSFSSQSINLKQRKNLYETPRPKYMHPNSDLSKEDFQDNKKLKSKILNQNKVFQKYSRIISNFDTRQSLPEKFTPQQKFSVISTFTSALISGSDLTKITMPVTMNEPISMLQKGCQQMRYSSLLNRADNAEDQNLRILYVAAFTVAGYSLNQFRIKRPFTPLLGETFEYIDQGKSYQFLGEQVSDQPPISAYHIRSDNYQIFDNTKSKISFTGNGIKTTPQSKTVIKLETNNDIYVISKAQVTLNNILFGKTSVDIYGQFRIKCKQFNTQIVIEFQQQSFWKGTHARRILGHLLNNNKKVYIIQGFWNKQLIAENVVSSQKIVLWKKSHKVLTDYYNFNQFSMQLNNLTTHGLKNLPGTDSRFRPDQRALEFRDIQLANEEKQRIEQNQRKRKHQNEALKRQHKVLWFKESVLQGQDVFISNDKYWDEKIKGSWKKSLDIF